MISSSLTDELDNVPANLNVLSETVRETRIRAGIQGKEDNFYHLCQMKGGQLLHALSLRSLYVHMILKITS